MKKILILGAGLVARPMVRYLLEQTSHEVTVASRTAEKAAALIAGHPRGRALGVLVDDLAQLDLLVQAHDLVVSLVPYTHHPAIAKLCLQHGKHLVTTSYVSPAMRELDGPARERGLVFLNEIGLDPGIDHMSAMRIIHRVHDQGGQIESFKSYCGGLPAPEANTNPLGYKLSWSPRGVAMAGRNEARFRQDGQDVVIPGPELFGTSRAFDVPGVGRFEAYPNRNSLPYLATYGIADAHTMVRGTLRHPGWCQAWQALADLGYLKDESLPAKGLSYAELTARLISGDVASLRQAVTSISDAETLERLAWLGILGDERVPGDAETPLDALCSLMNKMAYAPGERDMIVLFHELVASYPDGTRQTITSTFVDYGIPGGDSAMARTVSLPAAIAVTMILDGQLGLKGVQVPVTADIYQPVLAKLEALGLVCKDVYGERLPRALSAVSV